MELELEGFDNIKHRKVIIDGIATGQKIILITYSLTEQMERQIDFVIAVLLKKYSKPELQSTLYSLTKELIVNATKANAKKTFFDDLKLDITNESDYEVGMQKLKENLSEEWIREYGLKAKQQDLNVRIVFSHNTDGLRIEIVNNLGIIPADEKRIREKLAEGMNYEDLMSFYMNNADQTEGEGIGLVMNLLLLKGEQINPSLFRIATYKNETVARLEIPLSDNFVSVRGKDPGGLQKEREENAITLDSRSDNE